MNPNETESNLEKARDWARLAGWLACEAAKLKAHPELDEITKDLNRWADMALDHAILTAKSKK